MPDGCTEGGIGAQQNPVWRENRGRIGQRIEGIDRLSGGSLGHAPIKPASR
jgi:hypothetical protein